MDVLHRNLFKSWEGCGLIREFNNLSQGRENINSTIPQDSKSIKRDIGEGVMGPRIIILGGGLKP